MRAMAYHQDVLVTKAGRNAKSGMNVSNWLLELLSISPLIITFQRWFVVCGQECSGLRMTP